MRPPARDVLLVTLLALMARAGAALPFDYAPYTDASYYTLVARQLAEGNGFTAPVIWSFLEVGSRIRDVPVLPVPSNGHWMPLASIIAAGPMALLGASWRAGQLPMIFLSAALVPFTYYAAYRFWGSRFVAGLASVLAIFAGPLLIYYPTVDNFAAFGVLGGLSLYAACHALKALNPGAWIVASGALAGAATLARVDGLLLTVAPATAWLIIRGWTQWARPEARVSWTSGFVSAFAFVAVLSPWLVRNLATYGSPLPSAGGHTLWITSYNEQFSIGHEVSLATYLDWGAINIIASKLLSWGQLVGRTGVLLGGIFLVSFVAGLWIHRRRTDLAPFLAYFVVMFVTMGGLFTFHAPAGAYYHTAPAWLPFALPMAVASIPPVAIWAGRLWPFLRRSRTHRFLAVAGTAGAVVLSVVGSGVIGNQWARVHRLDAAAAEFFVEGRLTDNVVMYGDPSSLALLSGNPGISPTYDPYPVLERLIDAYRVEWVVVQLLEGEETDALNLWRGGKAVDAEGNRAIWLESEPSFEVPGELRIFRVRESQ